MDLAAYTELMELARTASDIATSLDLRRYLPRRANFIPVFPFRLFKSLRRVTQPKKSQSPIFTISLEILETVAPREAWNFGAVRNLSDTFS
jgi:hypothetical protein